MDLKEKEKEMNLLKEKIENVILAIIVFVMIFIAFFMFSSCKSTLPSKERIVITDTTITARIDTTRISIVDTLHIYNRIDSVVFDTLYAYVDSIVVREVIKKANENIETTFNYDTTITDSNGIYNIKCRYNNNKLVLQFNSNKINYDTNIKEKVEEIKPVENSIFDWFNDNKLLLYLLAIAIILIAIILIKFKK